MYFLIDFENIMNEGLKGVQYLLKEDTVIIFYNVSCEQIRQGNLYQLMESSGYLDIFKLKKPGKLEIEFAKFQERVKIMR